MGVEHNSLLTFKVLIKLEFRSLCCFLCNTEEKWTGNL